MDWSWYEKWNWCARPNLYFTTKKKMQAGNQSSNLPQQSTKAIKHAIMSCVGVGMYPYVHNQQDTVWTSPPIELLMIPIEAEM